MTKINEHGQRVTCYVILYFFKFTTGLNLGHKITRLSNCKH